MSLRASETGDRYENLYSMFEEELMERLAKTSDGDPMWNLRLTKNDPKTTLGPRYKFGKVPIIATFYSKIYQATDFFRISLQ